MGGVLGIATPVVEEIADVVGPEHVDQPSVLAVVGIERGELVAAGTEGATGRMSQAGDLGVGQGRGIDQLFAQCPENAVPAREHGSDSVGVRPGRLDHAARGGVDHRGDAP